MTRSEFVFVMIDYICNPMQNYRRYPNVVLEKKDYVYDEKDAKYCSLSVAYDPNLVGKDKPLLPVVLNIHGGGFVKGDKKYRKSLAKRFASHGYFCVNINYTLSPKGHFPEGVIDCVNALNYVSVLAEKFNIDVNRVCVTGDSAGAHLATQLVAIATNQDLAEKIGAPKLKVKPTILVSFCGPYDLVKSISLTKLPFNMVWDIGRCYMNKEGYALKKDFSNIDEYENIECASPINWVNEKWCPCYLVMSEKDIFCKGQGEILKEKLDELGVENKTFASTKFIDNHCFHMNFWTKISKNCFKDVFAFMDEKLK